MPPLLEEDEPAPAPPPVRPIAASARFEETTRPTRVQPSFSLVSEAEPEPELPPPLEVDEGDFTGAAEVSEAPQEQSTAIAFAMPEEEAAESIQPAEFEEAPPVIAAAPAPPSQTSVKVSDLEKEMARLLGEISTSRSS